jgi:hypothetical protein
MNILRRFKQQGKKVFACVSIDFTSIFTLSEVSAFLDYYKGSEFYYKPRYTPDHRHGGMIACYDRGATTRLLTS